MSGYQLWDTLSGDLLDDFGTESDALECVQGLFEARELDEDPNIALVSVEDSGDTATIADGQALVRLARARSENAGRAET